MKRFLALLLCFILVPILLPACAETANNDAPKLDMTLMEKMDGYKYDKFDRKWSYKKEHTQVYNNANAIVGLQVQGEKGSVSRGICWYFLIRKPNSTDTFADVSSVDFLIDDTLYSYPKVYVADGNSFVYVVKKDKVFIEALAEADEISVRLSFKGGSTTFDIPSSEYESSFKEMAKNLLDIDIWKYIDDPEGYDVYFEKNYPLETE